VGAAEVKRFFTLISELLSAESKVLKYTNPEPDEDRAPLANDPSTDPEAGTSAGRPEGLPASGSSGTKSINAGVWGRAPEKWRRRISLSFPPPQPIVLRPGPLRNDVLRRSSHLSALSGA